MLKWNQSTVQAFWFDLVRITIKGEIGFHRLRTWLEISVTLSNVVKLNLKMFLKKMSKLESIVFHRSRLIFPFIVISKVQNSLRNSMLSLWARFNQAKDFIGANSNVTEIESLKDNGVRPRDLRAFERTSCFVMEWYDWDIGLVRERGELPMSVVPLRHKARFSVEYSGTHSHMPKDEDFELCIFDWMKLFVTYKFILQV